ncbi:MAG: hypothetical protein K9G62_06355 [Alphaproteobacteria bacterium]|nr:hypothetical protein [Alphaproteobacteria bacterium]
MEIIRSPGDSGNEPFHVADSLKPLFNALEEGKTIKRIRCMGGSLSKDNPSKDFFLQDFVAESYKVGHWDDPTWPCDRVSGRASEQGKSRFYMNWVREFKL